MVETMRLRRLQKEKEFRQVVNSPFHIYKFSENFTIYDISYQGKSGKEVLVPIEVLPRGFKQRLPTNKDSYHVAKLADGEKRLLFQLTQNNYANFLDSNQPTKKVKSLQKFASHQKVNSWLRSL